MSRNQRKFVALREWAATVKAGSFYLADLVKDLNETSDDADKREAFDLTDVKPGGDDGR